MNKKLDQDPAPYIEMRKSGATAQEVFKKAKHDGYKNFECIALISGVFDIPLSDAREMAHTIHREEEKN